MQVLSKGFKKPQTGDLGTVWFAALEDNTQQTNDHNHNGNNSEKISSINLSTADAKIQVLSGTFVDQGNGYWRSTVAIPTGSVDDYQITIRDPATKETIHLKTAKFSSNQLYIFTNFVQDFEVFLGL